MKKLFMAVIALMMTISASAQFYVYFSDGTVAKVDSISMVAPADAEDPTNPDTPTIPDNPSTPSQGVGAFSVSADKQVTFSPGNLQYHPANNEWRFAENQTDYIGADNSNISDTYDGWLDMFGWSTVSTYFGVTGFASSSDYSGSFVDWGVNKIGNDLPNTWRTLTEGEWDYLLNTRNNASSLFGVAQVNGVNGLIFLPDNWTCPSDVTFKSGFYGYFGAEYYAENQIFTSEQWSKLSAAGAVFLPATGHRFGSYVDYVQTFGRYWSATEESSDDVVCLYFYAGGADLSGHYRAYGQSVRLVKDVE